jgi:RNA polymerase sigma factor (sigma-70 family)
MAAYTAWRSGLSRGTAGNRQKALAEVLRRIMDERLSERERQLAELRWGKNVSCADIARRMGLSRSTVSRTLAKTRVKLKAYVSYLEPYARRLEELDDRLFTSII